MPLSDSKVLIVGAGAIGSLYGGKLAQAGMEVSVVCRSDFSIVREQGFVVKSIWGDFSFRPRHVLQRASQFKEKEGREPDYLIIATKVLPDLSPSELAAGAVGEHSTLVLLQNGIDIEAPWQQCFPQQRLISGIAYTCCNRIAPGMIDHLDYGRLTLGFYPEGQDPVVESLAEKWGSVGVPVQISRQIAVSRWKKLVWNAPFNPISVLAGQVSTHEMIHDKTTVELVRNVMQEVFDVALAAGYGFDATVMEQTIIDTLAMTPYKTSMLLDFEAKRPMEIDAILGNAIRVAHRYQVPVPSMKALYALLTLANHKNLNTPPPPEPVAPILSDDDEASLDAKHGSELPE